MTRTGGRTRIAGVALIIMAIGGLAIPAATTTAPALAATNQLQGVDVSSLQHPTATSTINWTSVASAGKYFTGIKASEGNYYTNPYYAGDVAKSYEADASQAVAAGLYVTPYVFANPYDSTTAGNGTAAEQADTGANVIKASTSPAYSGNHMLPVTLDIEPDPYVNTETNSNQCYGLSQSAMVTWISQFLTRIKNDLGTTKAPIIYTTADWWNACTGNYTGFSSDPLWLASYGVTNPGLPTVWNNYTIWQYGGGSVSGISGSGTDEDVLGPVLQVSQAGQTIGAVQLRTLTSLTGTASTYSSPTGLPPGLQLNTSTGQITGTPTTIGQYTATVNTNGVPSSMSFTWDVHGAITLTSPGNRTTTAGTPVLFRIPVSDQDGSSYPPTLTASGLPPGMTMDSSGLITGWPTKPGTYSARVSASDGLYASASIGFTWTITAAADSGFTGAIRQVGLTGKCLNVPAGATPNGTQVNLWACNGLTFQAWTAVQDGTIRVEGKCLSVINTTSVGLWACSSNSSAQQWRAGTDGELVNAQFGTCVYYGNATAANGTRTSMSTCRDLTSQTGEHWSRPAANVYSGEPGKCMAVSGSAVQLTGCANVAAQQWQVASDGTIRLGSQCLTEAGTTAGSALTAGSCSGAATTTWKLVSATGGQVPGNPIATEIQSANSASPGLCVATPSSAAGTPLKLQACSATTATLASTWHVE